VGNRYEKTKILIGDRTAKGSKEREVLTEGLER